LRRALAISLTLWPAMRWRMIRSSFISGSIPRAATPAVKRALCASCANRGRDPSVIADARHRLDNRIGIVDGENLRPLVGEQNRGGAALALAGTDARSRADHCNFAFHASRHEPFLSAGGALIRSNGKRNLQ
jgi:hypothetical protein